MRSIIIAEAGVNHNGSVKIAKELIDAAAIAGADYVKFQTFNASKLVSRSAQMANYQKRYVTDKGDLQFDMLKSLELDKPAHFELKKYCTHKGIQFLSSGFDEESIDFLEELGVPLFKIPSGEITNKPFLQHVASKGKPVILSTGMSDLQEVKAALDVMLNCGLQKDKVTVLHCNTEYPTPMKDVNLRAMLSIHSELGVKIGYSDHTLGVEIPIAAVALGAEIIEKHFTLNHSMPGPDHQASLDPLELKAMVIAIRNVELAMQGSGIKHTSDSERSNQEISRKSVHIKYDVEVGTKLTYDQLIMKRPGTGISPMDIDKVVGKEVKVTLKADTLLSWDHLKE